MKHVRIWVVLILVLSIPLQSHAWGVTGHRVVAGIAELYLTPKAKKQVGKLLGNESLAMAANWGDYIKSDSFYNYLNSWHYINLPGGMTANDLSNFLNRDTGVDLFTKLKFVTAELKNKSLPNDKQVFYLKLLIHFVGDIHQPMHTAHINDKGGNNLKVLWFNTPSNLHRVWDEQLVDFQQLSYSEYIKWINHSAKSDNIKWQKQPIKDWVAESYGISERLYTEVHQDDKLGYGYNYNHLKILNNQLLKGGIRLAGVLNELYR